MTVSRMSVQREIGWVKGWCAECDRCGRELPDLYSSEVTASTTARLLGWRRSEDGQHTCDLCLASMQRAPEGET